MPHPPRPPMRFGARFALADLSMDDKSQILTRALEKTVGRYNCYVRDVYEGYLIYYDYDDGATYQMDYAIADDYTVTFGDPEEVIQRSVYEPVKMSAFSLSAAQTLGAVNVYANSLLFEIQGDSEHFPGQGLTVTKQDLADIVAGFSGASMGLEHEDTVLGDRCGDIRSIWLDGTGRRLFGDVAIPKGLDELIPPGPRRVSVEIYRDAAGKMSIPKVDLVLNPQIERAALMSLAAFAKDPSLASDSGFARTGTARPDMTQGGGRPAPKETARVNDTNRNDTTTGNENGRQPGFWDRLKAFFKEAGMPTEDEPAYFSDPQVAEFRRKAQAHDAAFARRKETAKSNAVIGFDSAEATRFGQMIDAAPEGIVFEDLEHRALAAAQAKAPANGAARITAPTAFGKTALEADAPGGADQAGEVKLEPLSSTFSRRAQEFTAPRS